MWGREVTVSGGPGGASQRRQHTPEMTWRGGDGVSCAHSGGRTSVRQETMGTPLAVGGLGLHSEWMESTEKF